MRKNEIAVPGTVTSSGGLKMFMGEVNEFFKQHKGEKIIARFIAIGNEPSHIQRGYYFNYIVPEMKTALWQNGDRKTEEETETFLREISPVCYSVIPNITTGRYEKTLRPFTDLSSAELSEHIEFIKQTAAEEYGVFIDDPNTK